MTAHTPPPWTFLPRFSAKRKPIVERGREGGFEVHGSTPEREDADARLIAAAPEMLALLREALTGWEDEAATDHNAGAGISKRIARARALLAKIKG